jgi:hypothetical protein
MLTFTIDRNLFDSAEEALKWVAKRRAIPRVIEHLRPYLESKDYFYVVEFQKDGGWPHWHVLVNSTFVPIAEARAAWRRCVPKDRRHLIRPSIDSMGIVRFSKPDGFKSAKHAGLYVSKYLTKYPEDGFPDWIMSANFRIRRYGTSRGFWGTITPRKALDPLREPREQPVRSHEERVEGCCETSSVYAVSEEVDPATGEVMRERKFLGRVACSGRLIARVVAETAKRFPGLGVYCRSAFVSYLGTWKQFKDFFEVDVVNDTEAEKSVASLEFVGHLKMAPIPRLAGVG